MIFVYLVGVGIVYLVMLCFGELLVVMFVMGVFYIYVVKYIGLGIGFMVVWLYWLIWIVVLGLEFIVVGLLM